jgi:hypothetical protein
MPRSLLEAPVNTILRTSFVEQIAFLEPPDYDTRQALKAAGFRYDGIKWTRTHAITSTLSKEQLEAVIKPE